MNQLEEAERLDYGHMAPEERIILEMPATRDGGLLVPHLYSLVREYNLHGVMFSEHSHVEFGWQKLAKRAMEHSVFNWYFDANQFEQDEYNAAATVKDIVTSRPSYLTINALSGRRAMEESNKVKGRTLLMASTVSSSLSVEDCVELYGAPPEETVLHLGSIAMQAGLDGIVASGQEMRALHDNPVTKKAIKVATGIRLDGQDWHTQKRVTTPGEALNNGADLLIVGRAVSDAEHPSLALKEIIKQAS